VVAWADGIEKPEWSLPLGGTGRLRRTICFAPSEMPPAT
jgi:hypothetical protein